MNVLMQGLFLHYLVHIKPLPHFAEKVRLACSHFRHEDSGQRQMASFRKNILQTEHGLFKMRGLSQLIGNSPAGI